MRDRRARSREDSDDGSSGSRVRSRSAMPTHRSVSMPCHLSPCGVTCEWGDREGVPCAGARREGGPVIFDVFVPGLLMLSPFVILALPGPDSRRRRRRQCGL